MFDSNYANDCRVRAKGNHRPAFNRQTMTLTLGGLAFPAKFKICSLCEGKGTHVNPSIDSHGLSSEDFAEDPDFAEAYFGGRYDIVCNSCNGEKLVPVVDTQKLTNEQRTQLQTKRKKQATKRKAEAQYQAMVVSELRYGC